MSALIELGLAIACGFFAGILHEVTHYLVAAAFGRNPRFDWREFAEFHERRQIGQRYVTTWEDYLINAAPLLVGIPVAAVVWWAWPVPWWVLVGLYFYAVHGALTNDLPPQSTGTVAD